MSDIFITVQLYKYIFYHSVWCRNSHMFNYIINYIIELYMSIAPDRPTLTLRLNAYALHFKIYIYKVAQ